MLGGLVLLAAGAASYEDNDSFVHFGPPEIPSDQFDRFVLVRGCEKHDLFQEEELLLLKEGSSTSASV